MSTNLAGLTPQSYQGQLNPGALPLGPSKLPPTAFRVDIDWLIYGGSSANPNLQVGVNLQAGTPRQKLDRIASVYIDNTNSPNPIYVSFPDTQYVITAAAYTAAWHYAFTNGLLAYVSVLGLATGQIPTTSVYFTNQVMLPDISTQLAAVSPLMLASPNLGRVQLLNASYGVAGLGDQANLTELICNGVGANSSVFAPTQGSPVLIPSKFLIVNALMANVLSGGATVFDSEMRVDLVESGTTTTLYSWWWNSLAGIKAQFNLPPVYGVNIKLDGTKNYSLKQVTGSNNNDRLILMAVFTQTNIG